MPQPPLAATRAIGRVPIAHGDEPKFTEAVREVAAGPETASGNVAEFLHPDARVERASVDATHVVHPTE